MGLMTFSFSNQRDGWIPWYSWHVRIHRGIGSPDPPPSWKITSFTDYTLHALWPYIDTEINHIRQFIKIKFVNKGIEFMILPNIVKDK